MTTSTDLGRRPSPRPRPESDDADAVSRVSDPVTTRVSDARTTGVSDAVPTRVSDAATRGVSDAATERHAAVWAALPDEFARDRADPLGGSPSWAGPSRAPFGSAWHDTGRDDDVSLLPGLTDTGRTDTGRTAGTGPASLSGPVTTGTATARAATRSSRRAMSALGVLCALSVGFLGGVVVHAHVARTAGVDATGLTGQVEASGDGVLSVRGGDGRLTALRTTAGTRVVRTNPVAGALPPGTTVEVESRRDADGALTATEIQVGGGAAAP